ncbi:MAG TPA: hypothetical protein VJY15_22780 [Candidatus Acidoferrum sp.]|nr:hypothetical protein [Candidatus Acidoferrum sp.]
MKRVIIFMLIAAACLGVSWGAYQAVTSPPEPALSRYFPSGASLYLQAKDFSSLLSDWDNSDENRLWLKSNNYEVFSRSRLFLRLKDANTEFSKAAGVPTDANLLRQVAGKQSALAIFDIGKLEFLYITRLPSASSMQSTLWQTRSKFDTRSAGGVTFFLRCDPESEREVAFAVTGDYLLLATREDLLAGALQLLASGDARSIEAEPWWSQSVAAASAEGDLRMVLNLEKIVPSPYFRSYWVQQNITDMKQYSAAISDLTLSGKEYREERVLLRKTAATGDTSREAGPTGVADIVRLVPTQASVYEARANPAPLDCLALLETKILAPHLGPGVAEKLAPQVELTNGETGSSTDLETRIDQPPVKASIADNTEAALKDLLAKNPVSAMLQVESTEQDKDGVFVRMHSAVALLGQSEWNESAVRSALVDFVRPSLTAGDLGVEWQKTGTYLELNGLWTLSVAVRGKYLLISDHGGLLTGMLANANQKTTLKPAVFVAGFDHQKERDNFAQLTGLLDKPAGGSGAGSTPNFFSDNIASLSSALAGMSSERIVIRDAGNKVSQAVTYKWAR